MLALAAGAAGVALLLRPAVPPALAIAFVAGLAMLAGWQALSASWAPDPARAREDALRGALYAVAAAAAVVTARAAGPRAVLVGVAGGIAVTLAWGLAAHARRDAPDPFQGDLLHQPIGYANAVGILAAIALVLAAGLLLDRPGRRLRAALLLVAGLATAALVLTESRGAGLAAATGLVTLAVFRRRRLLGAWLALVPVAVVAILVAPLVTGPERLHALLSDRAYYWPLAWHSLEAPLRGLGSGGFAQLWALERPVPVNAIDAHSLFLETLLELGAVGLAVLVATLALPLAAALKQADRWAAGAAGAYTAFLVHAAVDWDWELPAVTVAGLACGVALLAAPVRLRA